MRERQPRETRESVEWVHVVVHVVLTTRTAVGLLLVVIDGAGADAGATMSAVVALTVMTLYLGRPSRWDRAARSVVIPLLDSLLAVVVLATFGTDGWALGYVAATVFLWALVGQRTPWVVALSGPMVVYLGLGLADLVVGDLQEALKAALRVVVVCLSVAAAARTRSVLHDYRSLELAVRAERLRTAQAEERMRLSVEMHDSVAKSLHGIHLMSAHLATRLGEEGHPASEQVALLRDSVDRARLETRELVASRRTVEDSEPSVALADLARTWQTAHPGLRLELDVGPFELGPGVAHELLSAVGELLENVARHAAADTVSLTAVESSGWVTVTVRDDGRGMASTRTGDWVARGHFGVDGVARRLARVSGSARFESTPGQGTTVVLEVPAHVQDTGAAERGHAAPGTPVPTTTGEAG